jgi:dipeptidyl aminopeptidase/acylaminoacyl peptidase
MTIPSAVGSQTRCRRLTRRVRAVSGLLVLGVGSSLAAQTPEKRPLAIDDLHRVRHVSDPQVSPDGRWVAYTVTIPNTKEDQHNSDVWMTSWDGSRSVRLTFSGGESEHTPRWSPDNHYLALLSGRGDEHEADQLWLLNRIGGEGERITAFPGGVSDYAWSPDGKRVALIVEDPDPDAAAKEDTTKTAKPIVIDRLQFKEDETGYLTTRRQHLYLLDLATRKAELLTPGTYNEALPAWSPDGKSIAFVSKRGPDMDRTDNWDLYVIQAAPGATPRQLTTFAGNDSDPYWASPPAWSPDGKSIAYLQGGAQKLIYYAVQKLAVIPASGGPARVLTAGLDRNVSQPHWSPDGSAILFLVEDDRASHLARILVAGGQFQRLITGRHVVSGLSVGRDGKVAVLASTPLVPPEILALDTAPPSTVPTADPPPRRLRYLSRQNASWLAEVELGATEAISFRSADGTQINGLLVKPPNYEPGQRYPTILRIHGGPVSQFGYEFDFTWQLLAVNGYVVVGPNPRGSSGRGEKFSLAIYARWGEKDAQDVLAAVDHVVAKGIADPERLGIGGWSYGGMLTNYTIARDTRFKAAVSGAGISNILAGYGTDQYVREYEAELGPPWKNLDAWLRVSFPFLHADRIVTPTLFLVGEADFNVPLLASEQMYQALRSLGRETQLVIYPDEYHEITTPSYQRDRLQRYLDWYRKYLSPHAVSEADGVSGER